MEEKTTSAGSGAQASEANAHRPGCFICNVALPLLERYWSDATRDHFRNSRIEFLRGIRSLIDHRIEHLSRHQTHQGTRVTVE
jgi:hypothetical protein